MMHPGCDHDCEAAPRPAFATTRRATILGLGATLALGRRSAAFAAGGGSARLVVINVRGGLDGLSLAAPYGDPYLRTLRRPLLSGAVGTPGGMIDLGGFYGLHPSMPQVGAMFAAGQASIVHAVGNCSLTRSHFDGQDYLQSGASSLLTSGWLNRAAAFVPAPAGGIQSAIAVDSTTPLLLRGSAPVAGWSPPGHAMLPASLSAAIMAANAADPLLGPVTRTAFADRAILAGIASGWSAPSAAMPPLAVLARTAGEFLAANNGPRIAALETASYDTHADQAGTLSAGLGELDQAIAQLKSTLAGAWASTVVLTITEFGRTAAVNGSSGTDHGTGFAMLLAGGALAGGKVIAQWPGLAPSRLLDNRDLAPTVDVRSVLMGVLGPHLGLSASALATVFPGSTGVVPLKGLF